jgi:hypothetical protein
MKRYRVSTKELCTFEVILKTNAAYFELYTYTSWQKILNVLFQIIQVIVTVVCLCNMPVVLKMASP